ALRPPWTLILGLAKDKEVDEVLAAIPSDIVVLRCGYRSTRARGPDDWPERATAWAWFPDVGQALAAVAAGHDACVTGSFYLAGEALTAVGSAGALPG
nr:hypothetical protein [Planctomycetota bacterium]